MKREQRKAVKRHNELKRMAAEAVDKAVIRGLSDRVAEEYILMFDGLSENIELDPKDQILFDKFAIDAFCAHPEVKDIDIAADGDKVYISFHQPYDVQADLFKKLNEFAPIFLKGDEDYMEFISPRDITRLLELRWSEQVDSNLIIEQTVQSGGHRAITDIMMEIMLNKAKGTAYAVSLYRGGFEKDVYADIYRNDNSIDRNAEAELNKFLSGWLDDLRQSGFERKEHDNNEDMGMSGASY